MSNSLQSYGRSPPGSSVHGILQARILERIAISSPGMEPTSPASHALQVDFLPTEPPLILLTPSIHYLFITISFYEPSKMTSVSYQCSCFMEVSISLEIVDQHPSDLR